MDGNVLYAFGGESDTILLDSWRYLSVPITDCDSKGLITHINWQNISHELPYYDYDINLNDYQQRVEIDINLEYLGYSYDHKTNGRYYLIDEALTWHEGQARCEEFGTNLATISSELENNEAYNLCTSASVYAQPEARKLGCFFGLNDLEIQNTFVYPGSSIVNYTNWDTPSQPHPTNNEHCGRINIVSTNGKWYDDPCYYKRPVLCNQINSGYGTSYIVSFSKLDTNQVYNNTNPCTNRLSSSFEDKSFLQSWTYSNYPFIKRHVSTNRYLAYPPPGTLWTLSANDANDIDSCTRINYNGQFSYNDFYDCANHDPYTSITITSDDTYINITATLYVTIVSPSSTINRSATYYSYQIINQSFSMPFSKALVSLMDLTVSSGPALSIDRAAIGTSEHIYILGGEATYGVTTNAVHRLNWTAFEWDVLPVVTPLDFLCIYPCTATINNQIYIYPDNLGGSGDAELLLIFDIDSESFVDRSSVAPMITSVESPCVTQNGNHTIYLIGGRNGNGYVQLFQIYSVHDNTWQQINAFPFPNYWGYACVYHSSALYVFGGHNTGNCWSNCEHAFIWKFDLNTLNGSWILIGNLSIPRAKTRAIVGYHDLIYIIGGNDANENLQIEYGTVDVLDPITERIIVGGTLSTPRYNHVLAFTNENIFIIGGEHHTSNGTTKVVSSTEITNKLTMEVLAESNACFDATSFATDHTFNAPANGIISGIKLVHASGGVSCWGGPGPGNGGSKWGCGPGQIMLDVLRVVGQSTYEQVYPTNMTDDVFDILPFDGCACNINIYNMNSYGESSDELVFINPTYSVTIDDQFTLQYSEGCCYASHGDNLGISCAQVYFLYDIIRPPTPNPTSAPTSSPTRSPSISPTSPPTGNPTSFTQEPTFSPSFSPTLTPSFSPSFSPTLTPSLAPSFSPTLRPSFSPSFSPSFNPSTSPTNYPSAIPSIAPSIAPSLAPTVCVDYGAYDTNDGVNELNVSQIANQIEFREQVPVSMVIDASSIAAFTGDDIQLNDTQQHLICGALVACFQSHIICSTTSNDSVCNILCNGQLSCSEAIIDANNVKTIHIICSGDQSCASTQVLAQNVQTSLLIDCVVPTSCNSMDISLDNNLQNTISCYLLNSCDNLNVMTTDYSDTKLILYSYSSNIILDNGFGLSHSGDNIDCMANSKFIRYDSNLIGQENDIETLIQNEYLSNTFPCNDNIKILCDQNSTDSFCIISYSIQSISTPQSFPSCYWVSVDDLMTITCPGSCLLSPTEPPTAAPSFSPTQITLSPTSSPSAPPTTAPSSSPTQPPSNAPSLAPSGVPSNNPTQFPSLSPSNAPSFSPSHSPSYSPSDAPSVSPTVSPTASPSFTPTLAPSVLPTNYPSDAPTFLPTTAPSIAPTLAPTLTPSLSPSNTPSMAPSHNPTIAPSFTPSAAPSTSPTHGPSLAPTVPPTTAPSLNPSHAPSIAPSSFPTRNPTLNPSHTPSLAPTLTPSFSPSSSPTAHPTFSPSLTPTYSPSAAPIYSPSAAPTYSPSVAPSLIPTLAPSFSPSFSPSASPTYSPSAAPTYSPTNNPTRLPTLSDSYPFWIDIVYQILNYSENNIYFILNDTMSFAKHTQEILETNYFISEDVLTYHNFAVEIVEINNVDVNDTDLTFDDLKSYQFEEPITLKSMIHVDGKDRGGSIITKSASKTYVEHVERDLEIYLHKKGIVFEVADADNLEVISEIVQKPEPTDWTVAIISIIIVAIGICIGFCAFIMNRTEDSKVDNASFLSPVLVSLQIYDLISDINLITDIFSHKDMVLDVQNVLFWCGVSAFSFTVIPFLSNIWYAVTISNQQVIKHNTAAFAFFKNHLAEFVLLVVVTGGCFPSLSLVSSRIFALETLNSGLTNYELSRLIKIKVRSTITLENGPQLVTQIVYTILSGGKPSSATILAFAASLLSIIATLATFYAESTVNKSDDITAVQYSLHFGLIDKRKKLDNDELVCIELRKERKKELTRAICSQIRIPYESLEIGFVKVISNGCVINIVHHVFPAQLKKAKKNISAQMRGFNVSIDPEYYTKHLCRKHSKAVKDVICAHFKLDNEERFIVQYADHGDGDMDVMYDTDHDDGDKSNSNKMEKLLMQHTALNKEEEKKQTEEDVSMMDVAVVDESLVEMIPFSGHNTDKSAAIASILNIQMKRMQQTQQKEMKRIQQTQQKEMERMQQRQQKEMKLLQKQIFQILNDTSNMDEGTNTQ
eukprot:31383_1